MRTVLILTLCDARNAQGLGNAKHLQRVLGNSNYAHDVTAFDNVM